MTTHTTAWIAAGAVAIASAAGVFSHMASAASDPGQTNAAVAASQPCQGRWAGRAGRWTALGLTDDQKAQVKAILQKYQPTSGPLIKDLVTERRALRDAIHAPTIDESAIRAQAAKLASLQADLDVVRAHVSHDIRAVLTPEQIQKLQERQVNVDARIDRFLQRVAKRIAED